MRRVVTFVPPRLSRALTRNVAVPAGPDATVKVTRYEPSASRVAALAIVAFPGWVNETTGRVDRTSMLRRRIVSVAPTLVDAGALIANASATTARRISVVARLEVAVTIAT